MSPVMFLAHKDGSKRRIALVVCAWLVSFPSTPILCAQQSSADEYQWKANFLAKSASFVEWPGDSPLHMANTYRWCVFGTFSFGTSLAEMTRDIVVDGKKSEVKWVRKDAELAACQIIFISRSEEKHYAKVLDAARASRALTVGETADFLGAGGMVALLSDGKSLGFEVNLGAMDAARVKMSSRLLALARRVVNHQASAKG